MAEKSRITRFQDMASHPLYSPNAAAEQQRHTSVKEARPEHSDIIASSMTNPSSRDEPITAHQQREPNVPTIAITTPTLRPPHTDGSYPLSRLPNLTPSPYHALPSQYHVTQQLHIHSPPFTHESPYQSPYPPTPPQLLVGHGTYTYPHPTIHTASLQPSLFQHQPHLHTNTNTNILSRPISEYVDMLHAMATGDFSIPVFGVAGMEYTRAVGIRGAGEGGLMLRASAPGTPGTPTPGGRKRRGEEGGDGEEGRVGKKGRKGM